MPSETVHTYKIGNRQIDVELNWEGKEPEDDPDHFYDFYDADTGEHLNEGEPWYGDDEGIPSRAEVKAFVE